MIIHMMYNSFFNYEQKNIQTTTFFIKKLMANKAL